MPGKIERAVEAVFRSSPDCTFSVADLLPHVYCGIDEPKKKHRVAILRAADKVGCGLLGWDKTHREAPGRDAIYFNRTSVISYALAKIRSTHPAQSLESAKVALEDALHHKHAYYRHMISPGGLWWLHAAHARAVRDDQHAVAHGLFLAIQEQDGKMRQSSVPSSRMGRSARRRPVVGSVAEARGQARHHRPDDSEQG